MSADSDLATLFQAFPGDADRVSSLLLNAYFVAQKGSTSPTTAAVDTTPMMMTTKGLGGATLSAAPPVSVSDSDQLLQAAEAISTENLSSGQMPALLIDAAGRLGVVFTATDPGALAPVLEQDGVVIAAVNQAYHRVEGYLPIDALPTVSNLGSLGLLGVNQVLLPKLNTGTVNSQADNVLEADRVRTTVPGYTGTGVRVGVLSDSYNKYTASPASQSIATGNLPGNVQVLQDYTSSATDEGRAMLELIYDLAPGAGLGFATAFISETGFASNIRALASNGYNVIVDDVSYFDEPFFQDGIVSQAVNDVVNNSNVTYFSSAGNAGNASYDSGASTAYGSNPLNFVPQTISAISTSASSYYDWDPSATGTTTMLQVNIPRGSGVLDSFQWDQPFYTTNGVTTNLDFYLLSLNTTTGVYTVQARAVTNNVTNQTPWDAFSYTNNLSVATNNVTQFFIVVRNTNGGPVPGRIKYVDEDGPGNVTYPSFFTNSGTTYGHPTAAGAMGVAAAPFFQQNSPEYFTSTGPATILFNADGSRKATAEVRAKPDITAIDGTDTSFFYPNSDFEGNGYPNFFGTSAAAPHAAAVAALIRQAYPGFSPSQVYARLKATADPNIGTGEPNVTGSGLIDAYRAIYGNAVATTVPTTDGFESGVQSQAWQVYKQGAGLTQVVSTNGPATGTYQLVMGGNIGYGTTGFGYSELNESIFHINAATKAGLVLNFSNKKFSNETDDAMPQSFTGHGNYDGVAFSVDGGTTWYRVISLTGANASTSYQNQSVNLSTLAASLGLTLTADTQIKFQQYGVNSYAIGTSGIAIDNVQVTTLSSQTNSVIDNGAAQRSSVRSLTLNYAGYLTTVPASAFALVRTSDNKSFGVVVRSVTHPTANTTQITLGWSDPTLEGTSLPDGRYTLTVDGSALKDDSGQSVDAAGNGTAGSKGTVSFLRFFGDSNGDGIVDASDYLVFLAAYKSGNATGANSAYDVDGNGQFTSGDLAAFMQRFTKRRLP